MLICGKEKYEYVVMHYEYLNKFKCYVNHWPDYIAISKESASNNGCVEVDENIVHFTVENGIARYYIVKGLEDDNYIYAKKFYGFVNRIYQHDNMAGKR